MRPNYKKIQTIKFINSTLIYFITMSDFLNNVKDSENAKSLEDTIEKTSLNQYVIEKKTTI